MYQLKTNLSSNHKNSGISEREALEKLKQFGLNEIVKSKNKSTIMLFIEQFKNFMMFVLIAATFASFFLGEGADAITILIIILINAVLGFIQEYRAEKSIEALKELSAPTAKVIREGKLNVISSKYIVPDDIVIVEAGDRIPADCIVIESAGLMIDESLLTGESVPVEKSVRGENKVYMGTIATSGRGKLIAYSTGMNTEMGKIANMLEEIEDEATPLQKKLEGLGKFIVAACLIICTVVSITGIIRGENPYSMLMTGISLAVAAIPEGLPAIVTVALALGVQRMYRRNALVRKLPAVETLGCTTVICSDKTGTLTQNKMTVKKIYISDNIINVEDGGSPAKGSLYLGGRKISLSDVNMLDMFLHATTACSDAVFEHATPKRLLDKITKSVKQSGEINESGDPTEIAMLAAAAKAGVWKNNIDSMYKRVNEIPFDSSRKRMTVVCRTKSGEQYVFVKGAVDVIMGLCNYYVSKKGVLPLTPKARKELLDVNEGFASQALRVLGTAYRKLNSDESVKGGNIESGLIFLGMMGMMDPPRPEVKQAIATCKLAGIKPVMITGDHKLTAAAVANELNMLNQGDKVVTGAELEEMSDRELEKNCCNISVYARVSPKHKLRIVKALKNRHHVVAMTGDGVNDAPAVKEADIGISMGITGTDVTKEASSMILLDDNFSTIVAAVEEGRIIYDNIRKFIRYLLSCNIGEVLTMFLASLIGLPVPLIPLQILWVNLVTDGLPAMALGVDPPDPDIMFRKPRGKKEGVFSRGLARKIIVRGIVIGLGTLCVFALMLYLTYGNINRARTCALASLILSQLFFVFECRSEYKSIWRSKPFSNKYLVLAVLFSVLLLLTVIYIPFFQPIFETVALSAIEWAIIVFMSIIWTVLSSIGMSITR